MATLTLKKKEPVIKKAKKNKRKRVRPETIARRISANNFLHTFAVIAESKLLAIGIDKQIFDEMSKQPIDFSKKNMRFVIAFHCKSFNYIINDMKGVRYNLDGSISDIKKPVEVKS